MLAKKTLQKSQMHHLECFFHIWLKSGSNIDVGKENAAKVTKMDHLDFFHIWLKSGSNIDVGKENAAKVKKNGSL